MRYVFLIIGVLKILTAHPVYGQPGDKVEIRFVSDSEKTVAIGVNQNSYPVTIHISSEKKLSNPSRNLPIVEVIPPGGQKDLFNVPGKQQMNLQYFWLIGSAFAAPDPTVLYRLPFKKGSSFRLDQGYDGKFSHTDKNKYALDFAMPEGTEVVAARQGIVVFIEDGYSEGGPEESYKDKANVVTILHSDGTLADYVHLKYKSVKVSLGQRVDIGHVLGLSGTTGFTTGPHLHFLVKKASITGEYTPVKVEFMTIEGVVREFTEGKNYTGY